MLEFWSELSNGFRQVMKEVNLTGWTVLPFNSKWWSWGLVNPENGWISQKAPVQQKDRCHLPPGRAMRVGVVTADGDLERDDVLIATVHGL